MHILLNGVTADATSQTRNVNGLHTITCKGLKSYKQYVHFYISIDNINFVLFKTINIEQNAFGINVGPAHIYCKFETEIEFNDPVFVHLS